MKSKMERGRKEETEGESCLKFVSVFVLGWVCFGLAFLGNL